MAIDTNNGLQIKYEEKLKKDLRDNLRIFLEAVDNIEKLPEDKLPPLKVNVNDTDFQIAILCSVKKQFYKYQFCLCNGSILKNEIFPNIMCCYRERINPKKKTEFIVFAGYGRGLETETWDGWKGYASEIETLDEENYSTTDRNKYNISSMGEELVRPQFKNIKRAAGPWSLDSILEDDNLFEQVAEEFYKVLIEYLKVLAGIPHNPGHVSENEAHSKDMEEHNTPHISPLSDEINMILKLLEVSDSKAIILSGPPGSGKTHLAKQIAKIIVEESLDKWIKDHPEEDLIEDEQKIFSARQFPAKTKHLPQWAIVQFHPGYTYEDFIGGIMPVLKEAEIGDIINEDGTESIVNDRLLYKLQPGIFYQFCKLAMENKNNKYVLIIDEINRADLSAVFGEILYALEYRKEGITIPHFKDKFTIPDNIYIIGTMNNLDKSLVTFDLALRRRFTFYQVEPDMDKLAEMLSGLNPAWIEEYKQRCIALNDAIKAVPELGEDYQIGQAYFKKIRKMEELQPTDPQDKQQNNLQYLWSYHLQPLLEESLGNRKQDKEIKQKLKEMERRFTSTINIAN